MYIYMILTNRWDLMTFYEVSTLRPLVWIIITMQRLDSDGTTV